jgi:uncharacterized protein (TIGR02147 family)
MKANVFGYKDYKLYLRDQLTERGKTERGPKARLAEFIPCSLAYLSQVLNGEAHLNSEQADGCNRFFGHGKIESLYFLNLLHYARAGTQHLRQLYLDELNEIGNEQNLIKNRLALKKTLSSENQSVFYSSWDYLATQIIVSIPQFQEKRAISEALGISLERVAEILDFLQSLGLVTHRKAKYEMAESGIHLGAGSPFLIQHLTNWRVQALRSLDQMKPDDIHYSSVVSCNSNDIPKIREVLLSAIQQIRQIVKESKNEECLMSYGLDLFPLTKGVSS